MRKRQAGMALMVLALAACASAPPEAVRADLILTSVNVVDVETATILANQDVVIEGGRIREVRAAGARINARAIDARGQYLIPGLWDMHVHLEAFTAPEDRKLDPRRWHAPLSISYGVLGLRDMGSRTGDILALRAAFQRARAAGQAAPNLRVAGQSFSGKQPWGAFDHTLIPQTETEAADMVRAQAARGVDFIKVHDFIAPEIYRAIAAETRAAGLPLIGHLRGYAGPREAVANGQKDFDHLPPELLSHCGDNGRRDAEAFYRGWYTGGPGYYEREMAKLYNPDGCRALFAALAASGATVTPTLSVRAPVHERTYAAAGRLLPQGQMKKCTESKAFLDNAAGADADAYRAMIGAVVRDLSDARVDILTGTDGAPESCGIPGLILLDELDELVAAGLTPAQVLRAATYASARKAGAMESGAIKAGASADLVLLSANPLDGLAPLADPAGVVSAGAYLDRDALRALRDGAAAHAQSPGP